MVAGAFVLFFFGFVIFVFWYFFARLSLLLFQKRDTRSSLGRLGVKLCHLQEQGRIDNATTKVDVKMPVVGSNTQAIFAKILNAFDGNETKENIDDLETDNNNTRLQTKTS